MDPEHVECIKNIMMNENVEEYTLSNDTNEFNGDNYMGTMAKIQVTGKDKMGAAIRKNLILKIAPSSQQVRSVVLISQFYYREVFAYRSIFSVFTKLQDQFISNEADKFPFIDFYDASLKEPKEFLFIRDIGPDGFVMYPRGKPFDLKHVQITLEYLAKFHALSFALSKHQPDTYKEIINDFKKHQGFSEKLCIFIKNTMRNALQYMDNGDLKEKFKKVATYDECLRVSSPEISHPFNVICHGDFWQNNIMFKYKDGTPVEVRFVDWQLNKVASPVVDISHLIFSVTEQSLRQDHYDDMLGSYYDTLSKSLIGMQCDPSELYPESVFQQQLNQSLVYGLIWGISALTFSLREKEDLLDLEKSVNTIVENNEYDFSFKSDISANKFTNRVKGILQDFVALGIME